MISEERPASVALSEVDKPWLVFPGVLDNPAEVVKTYGSELEDLNGSCSEGETRIVDGRRFDDENVQRVVRAAFEKASAHFGIEFDEIEPLGLLRYSAGGEYSWHGDNTWTECERRKLSVVLTLNDEFVGGGTEFMWPRPEVTEIISPPPGGLVVFPSTLYHRAVRTESGVRWIIIGFATGKPFR